MRKRFEISEFEISDGRGKATSKGNYRSLDCDVRDRTVEREVRATRAGLRTAPTGDSMVAHGSDTSGAEALRSG